MTHDSARRVSKPGSLSPRRKRRRSPTSGSVKERPVCVNRRVAHPTVFRVRFFRISSLRKQLWVGHVFIRFGTSGLQELVEAEEFAAEGAGVGGPFGFAGLEREGGTDGGEFGIEIVEVVKDEGFANHRELRRAKLVLAVMADEKMLDD